MEFPRGAMFLHSNPYRPYPKIISQVFVLICLILEAEAFWILPCRQRLSLGRIDPIVSPGSISAHVHTIHGGNGEFPVTNCAALGLIDNSIFLHSVQRRASYVRMFQLLNQAG